jgi:hypothetical protein
LENSMQDQDYLKILSVINTLDQSGILANLADNCVLAADVIQNMLHGVGVTSAINECQLMIVHHDTQTGKETVNLVGYDISTPQANQINTHAVVITKGENAYMIDVSIGNYLGNAKHVVVTVLTADAADASIFAQTQAGAYKLIYRTKQNPKLPSLHQKDLVARIQQEYQLLKSVRMLKYLVIFAIAVSVINAGRGFYDFYNNYFSDAANIGISVNREIVQRLDNIEQKLHNHQ